MRKNSVGLSPNEKQATEPSFVRMFRLSVILLILAFILFVWQLVNLDRVDAQASELESLPVSIRAESEADYSGEPQKPHIPVIDERILIQIITDMPATGSPQDRVGTL